MAQRPEFRVSLSRKDGQLITYQDYKGTERISKYAPIGDIWLSKSGKGYNLSLTRKVTIDPAVFWVNVFPNTPREEDGEAASAPAKSGGDVDPFA